MAPKSIAAISHDEREELRKKGIKSPSKLLSPKYLSPVSIKELNKNPSAPKRVHFVNSIVILSTDSDTEEEDVSSTNACGFDLGGMIKGKEGVKEQGMEENEMEIDMEIDDVIEEEESEFETDGEVEEILKEEEDDEDGSFAYECDFMILEDTTSIIDRHLGEMVFGRPFIDETGLIYNKEEGTVMFEQDDEKITFKMPHTMEIFKQTNLMGLSTDSIPPLAYEETSAIEGCTTTKSYLSEISTSKTESYIADSDPEEDEEDPKEDPANHPADGGDNDNNESSDDDDDDDDVKKDEEDDEEEENLALADPSAILIDDLVPLS
ncbi:hypothetical protein Tco_1437960 [Tanacetum coccineum]